MTKFIVSGHKIDPGITPMRIKNASSGAGFFVSGPTFQSPITLPDTILTSPSIVTGDSLVVCCLAQGGSAFNPIEAANWTQQQNIGFLGNIVWRRIATGDSNDTFTIPSAQTNLRAFKFIVGKSAAGWFGANTLAAAQVTAPPTTIIPFNSASLPGGTQRTHQLSFLFATSTAGAPNDTALDGAPSGFAVLEQGEVLTNLPAVSSNYGIYFRHDSPPVVIPADSIQLSGNQVNSSVAARIIAPHGPFV